MTTTATKIAGEAMTDEQIIEMASRFAHSDGWLNGDGAIAFARALLASKPAVPVQDEIADGELIADLIEQNRTLRARLAAHASPSGEDAAEQSAAPMAGPKMPNGFQISCDPLSAVEACINDYEQEKETPVSNAILSGLYKARQVLTLPRASEKADEAVTDGVAHFNWLCSLMPEGFHWGEPLTPDVLDHIAIAARAKDSK